MIRKIKKAVKQVNFSFEKKKATQYKKYNIELESIASENFVESVSDILISINIDRAVSQGSHVYYKGYPSSKGARIDAMEGCTRMLPLIAVYSKFVDNNSRYKNHIKESILEGTNRNSKWYWGDIEDYDQRFCEMHDVALTLWFMKKEVFQDLNDIEKKQIKVWLLNGMKAKIKDNNWILFLLLTQAVYDELYNETTFDFKKLSEFLSFYQQHGLFTDGKDEDIDHYNSWAIHYTLFFIYRIKSFDFIPSIIVKGGSFYLDLISYDNYPLYGRSLCYKYALPTSALIRSFLTGKDKEKALSLTVKLWKKFSRFDSFEYGLPSQISKTEDRYSIEPYIGPASSLWSVRSLIISILLKYEDSVELDIKDEKVEQYCIENKISFNQYEVCFTGKEGGSINPSLLIKTKNKLMECFFSRNILVARSKNGKITKKIPLN